MPKRINIALQGGGAHGAFTWGALDVLLQCPEIEIAAITGTSAGALNGAAVKAGIVRGGVNAARANLDWLWSEVAGIGDEHLTAWLSDLAPPTAQLARAIQGSPAYAAADTISRMVSPYVWGPFYTNPLEGLLSRMQFEDVCAPEGPALFVCATNVRTGKIRVFTGEEIGPKTIMASACLPTLFQAVEVADEDGTMQAYWDGGYTGNPALFPLYEGRFPDDIVVVNINPIHREELPVSPQEILNRINEISFNSSLLRELRAIDFVRRLIAEGRMPEGVMRNVKIHMIADDALMNELSVATKIIPTAVTVARLKTAGQAAAQRFLDAHLDDLNVRPTVDLGAMFG
ncbi:phospholipase, patatin-like family [Oceaniovalibus guishaninsula JLT2003]|uniref:Phospholipase, patatin-like family n=1 Tax=Oceaniovalibus guishaninsula JLT2003 TaxID=1231392 RepID=K2HKL9_9RHOB|nr:patatin-like phospholipase family protein [Oceaniovalibus guishaninsula]EKE43479.1 phospholipase, patatin-like family [Oceaniovalibus guishaninsula JLT2003]